MPILAIKSKGKTGPMSIIFHITQILMPMWYLGLEASLTRDIPKVEIEAEVEAEAAACEAQEAEEVEAVPEVEIIVPDVEAEVEACANPEVVEVEAEDAYPEGYDAQSIIF